MLTSQSLNKWPKADPLHQAADGKQKPFGPIIHTNYPTMPRSEWDYAADLSTIGHLLHTVKLRAVV